MFLGEEIREAQNLNNDQQHQIHESTATGHETQQGYSQGLVLASTEPSMTNLMHEATQNVTPFGMNPQDQQGSLMRLNGLPGVSQSPMGAGTSGNAPECNKERRVGADEFYAPDTVSNPKSKTGHKSGLCQYCHRWFERLSMHKCKLSPESAQKGITGLKKRQVSSRDAQIGEDIQFRARQDRFLLELQQLIYRGHVELGFELNAQVYDSNRVLCCEIRTPQIHHVSSIIGEPLLPSLSNDTVNIGNEMNGAKDIEAASKAEGWGLNENSQQEVGNPLEGMVAVLPSLKLNSCEVSSKNTAKLMVGGNDGGISRVAETFMKDGQRKVKKGMHSLRFVEDDNTGQPKWLRCLMCPVSRYDVHGGKTPFACQECGNSYMHPECFMEYHKNTNLATDSNLYPDFGGV